MQHRIERHSIFGCLLLMISMILIFGEPYFKINNPSSEELWLSQYDAALTNSLPDIYLENEPSDKSGSLNVLLCNDSNETIIWGDECQIEVKMEGQWYEHPLTRNAAFFLLGYGLEPGGRQPLTYNLKKIAYKGTNEYRLIKTYYLSEETYTTKIPEYIVVMYFEIPNAGENEK